MTAEQLLEIAGGYLVGTEISQGEVRLLLP